MRLSIELVPKDPFWRMRVYAVTAERLGYDAVWLSEHHFNRSSVVAATYLALRTRVLRIGMGVLNPYAFSPALMAQFAASLTELAPGRVALSIGAGDPVSLKAMGLGWVDPLRRVEEAVVTVRTLLTGSRTEGHLRLDFRPRGTVPIYLAAQGKRMLELAGKVGDGVLINSANLPFLEESARRARDAATSAGREGFAVEAEVLTSLHEERAKAVKTVKPYVAVVLLGMPQTWRERLGVEEGLLTRLSDAVSKGDWLRIHEVLPDDLALALSVSGNAADVRRSLSELPVRFLDGIVFGGPLGPYPRRAINELWRVSSELFDRGPRGSPAQ
ncbi:MAG: LLM class flavin-dependent oxidoreductase [Nitrososphaerota archaeon]|nr:LLM class flavin-dependent oxidoreductase [Candidatus Calditenuis fumarioli]